MERIILATNVRIKRARGYRVDLPTGHLALRDTPPQSDLIHPHCFDAVNTY